MREKAQLAKVVCFPGLLLGCFVFGWMIPTFYDWSGAQQSSSTPAANGAGWALVGFGILSWCVIPWLPNEAAAAEAAAAEKKNKPFQLNLRLLFAITTIVAIGIAGIINGPVAFCILLWVAAFVGASWMVSAELSWKRQLSALLACMYFPFAWVLVWRTFRNMGWMMLLGTTGLPAFLPVVFLARSLGKHPDKFIWLAFPLTAIEIASGIWLIRTGPRRTTAYFVLVMLLSIYGSMFLNMGMRI